MMNTGLEPSVAPIRHAEAMEITAHENEVFASALDALGPDDWSRPTDCERWTVRDVVVHVIASAQAQASPIEFVRQLRAGRALTKAIGGAHWVDGLNEAQLRARTRLAPHQLPALWRSASAAALRARRIMPAPVRALPLLPIGEGLGTHIGWKPISYLFDMGFTRDVWMHRVDLAQAVDQPFDATADHDGRIVADIVAEWSGLHGDPFDLRLTGPAGGHYARRNGERPESVEMDAVEFCRMLSGRGARPSSGALSHALPL